MSNGNPEVDRALLDLIGSGETVLFIGAGFGLSPLQSEDRLRDRVGLRQTLAEAYKATLQGCPHDLETISLEDIVSYLRVGGVSKAEIASTLKSFLASSDELTSLESFSLLRLLVALKPGLFEAIITTNWDNGFEECLRGVPGLTLTRIVAEEDCFKYNSAHLALMKIHGDLDSPESIVLSSEDFDLYERSHPRIVERLRILCSTKYVVCLGYAAKDENFRRIFRALQYDLQEGLRGGWIVAPTLADREKLWAPSVRLKHVPMTAQAFLTKVLTHVARVPVGMSGRRLVKNTANTLFLEKSNELQEVADRVKRRFNLREVWVVQLRDGRRSNEEIGRAGAAFIEGRCREARTISISTGDTMAGLAGALDSSVFRQRVTVFPTIVLLAGARAFRDPSHIAQTLVARFPPGSAICVSLRLPDEEYLSNLFRGEDDRRLRNCSKTIRDIAQAQVARAMESDVIIGSVRPLEWFGSTGLRRERTLPFQWVSGAPARQLERRLLNQGVIAGVHHMALVDSEGQDATLKILEPKELRRNICGPSVGQLKKAAESSQKVVVVACHKKKMGSVLALLKGRLCNVLVVDEVIGRGLLGGT